MSISWGTLSKIRVIKAIRKRLTQLWNPEAWAKSIFLVIIAWLMVKAAELGFKYLDLQMEANFKSSRISLRYSPIVVLKPAELTSFAKTHGFADFSRKLDDDLHEPYAIVPLRFKNNSRNPIERVSFDIDLNCETAKIIDVQWLAKSPPGKKVSVRKNLPDWTWKPPTNDLYLGTFWSHASFLSVDVFASMVKDRGFGKVTTTGIDATSAVLRVSQLAKSGWYVAMKARQQDTREVILPEFLTPRKDLQGRIASNPYRYSPYLFSKSPNSELTSLSRDFLSGRTTVSFDSGFEPAAEIELFLLVKTPHEEKLLPSVKMEGLLGVAFEYLNQPSQLTTPSPDPLDEGKKSLMPVMATAVAASNVIVVCWDSSTTSSYSGVAIYRSPERGLWDFSNLGQKIFEGYGDTNAFAIYHDEPVPMSLGVNPSTRIVASYLQGPPNESPAGQTPPPSNLQVTGISWSDRFNGLFHFIDNTSERGKPVTYTIYALNQKGLVSYPIVVNAVLDESATNRVYGRIASTNETKEQPPGTYSLRLKWDY